jgi:hypothetical protein
MDAGTLAAITTLYRDHLRWAVWPPLSVGGQWTAVRPAGHVRPARNPHALGPRRDCDGTWRADAERRRRVGAWRLIH